MRLASSIAAACLLLSPCLPAQETNADTYRLSVSTKLVVLDVVVLDRNGKPVPNLDASQFSLFEDKAPQSIRHFEASQLAATDAAHAPLVQSTADLAKIGNAPVDILVFDELNSRFEDMAYSRAEMEKYLLRLPEILPVPTQLVAAGDNRFVVLHDYTQRRADLLSALATHMPQYPWQMMRGAGGYGALERMAQTLGILGQIADASHGAAGRKNVVWVGNGYPSVDTTQFGPEDQAKLSAVVQTVTARMLASRVALYVVDPGGVHAQTQEDDSQDGATVGGTFGNGLGPLSGKLEFTNFAAATGGEVFSERNDIDRAVEQGLRDAANYYTLSYTPTTDNQDAAAYRHIRIVMKDKSLHAITRAGYFPGPPPVEKVPDAGSRSSGQLKWDIAAAAQTTLPYDGLNVKAAPSSSGYRINVVAKQLTWKDQPDGSRHAEVTIMAVCFNEKDKQLSHDAKELTESIRATDDIEHGVRAGFAMPLKIPANTKRIRFVVRDQGTGAIGTVDVARP
ncbi:VWFA-related domain-containing protein [Granulicella rosea]|uniref:VWFA-related domain-containing protein n=1 Tax=Granulicella rosea TaxID=474952 RepID=A0A239LWA3_9BACT|nr:VWA domain-containing protein [Granulicella rosea]SNT34550.1 VWFA-related domain-containing protein [Granulicella rosea]